MSKTLFTGDIRESDSPNYGEKRIKVADKYYITGDIVPEGAPNYGEKRIEIGGGGGGDSDFTTAKLTVTVVNVSEETIPSADSEFAMYGLPTVQVNECYGYVSFTSPGTNIPTNGTYGGEYDVVLYKGYCITPSVHEWSSYHLTVSESPSVSVTGGVSIDGNGALTITGDGTITIPVEYYA